jgi:hypothetical protein
MQIFDNQDDLCFSFPESWKLDKGDSLSDTDSVTVVSPEGGFWCVRRDLRDTANKVVFEHAVAAMREVYPELEVEQVVDHIAGSELTGMDMHFFCLDLSGTASVRIWQTSSGNYVIFSQAEDEQLEQLKPIFNAITTSLIRGSEN